MDIKQQTFFFELLLWFQKWKLKSVSECNENSGCMSYISPDHNIRNISCPCSEKIRMPNK